MSVSDRWHTRKPRLIGGEPVKPCREHKLYPSADHMAGDRWQVRWRDEDGKQCSANRPKKGGKTGEGDPDVYAEALDAQLRHGLNRGDYTDPAAGNKPFKAYAEDIVANRSVDTNTRTQRRQRLAKHVYPVIGTTPLRALSRRPSLIQALIASMERAGLEASSLGVVMTDVSMVFNAAIDDGLITKNPCRASSVTLPTPEKDELVPWTAEQVAAVHAALPARYRAMVDCGAGAGLRQGEIFALSPDDVEWLSPEPVIHVRRQVKVLTGGLVFDTPKGRKTRTVPLADARKVALAEHMRTHPPATVTLPWRRLDGKPTTVRLFFADEDGEPLRRADFNPDHWKPAVLAAGMPAGPRENTMHDLRHYFAAVLLTAGESPKALSRWLGHTSLATTMTYYAHFMPQSDARMRKIIDAAMEPAAEDAPSRLRSKP